MRSTRHFNPRPAAGKLLSAMMGGLALSLTPTGLGQSPDFAPRHLEACDYTSPVVSGAGQEYVGDQHIISFGKDAAWLMLHFGHVNLGANSYIEIMSMKDGETLRLNGRFMDIYEHNSAYFNGDSLLITLHVAPGDTDVFYSIAAATVGEWVGGVPETICGPSDNRVASSDDRSGRLYVGGCTAWTNNYGSLMTAGHCVDFDPDDGGPLLPDGVLDLNGSVEINVPASMANGTPVAASVNNQYPIITAGTVWNFDGEGQGLGKDWCVFRCGPNANTGIIIHNAAGGGYYRVTDLNPGTTIRITGFGLDNTPPGSTGNRNAQNFTNQTHSGPYIGESSSGANVWYRYQVDTTGGNSGSPINWSSLSSAVAIGIHTNAGCGNPVGTSANSGTSMEHDPFQNAFHNFGGAATEEYVDLGFSLAWMENPQNGHANSPWHNVFDAVNALPISGGGVTIVEGTYTQAAGNTGVMGADGKSFFIFAPVGTAFIGN